MTKSLTLSVVIPAKQIKKSLALSLVDIDSHFNSLRYSSLEFVVLNTDDENPQTVSESFSSMLPSLIHASPKDIGSVISGENVIVINDERVERELLDTVTDFIRDDVSAAVISSQSKSSILDRFTRFLIKVLKFEKPLRSSVFPHVVYMERETFDEFNHLQHHELVTFFDFHDHPIEILEDETFDTPHFGHYLKVWFHLVSLKVKQLFQSLKSTISQKI